MKQKGFTLIELLAVIVILAIIALIATPIILGIINDAKKESARISAENYFDAVGLAISRKYMNDPNIDLDGTYNISNEGKTLTKGKIILTVEYDGKSQLVIADNSTITIEQGKVTSISNVKIDKWFAKIDSGKIIISDKLPTSILVKGEDFHMKIKFLITGSQPQYPFSDSTIKKIQFLSNGTLPQEHTLETLQKLPKIDVSVNQNNSILAYKDEDKIYIYSNDLISFNEKSNNMFYNFNALSSVEFGKINTKKVTDMSSMFSGCNNLLNIDIVRLETNNVTNMSSMFSGCSSLTDLVLSSFNTENVTNMMAMFQMCTNLVNLDISNFNTSKVTNMSYMFWNSNNLDKANYYLKMDTSSITDMSSMFSNYNSPAALDLSKLETNSVTNMSSMFSYYSSPAALDLSKLDTSSVTNMSGMFSNYSSPAALDLSKLDTSSVTDMSWMFSYYNAENILDLSNFNTSSVTNMSNMFEGYSSPSPLNLSSFDTSDVTDMAYMFAWIENPVTITVNKETWITDNANIYGMFEGSNAILTYSE